MTDANFDHARALLGIDRPDLAEPRAAAWLARHPGDAFANAMLAHCMAMQQRAKEALPFAREAVHLDPESAASYYVLAIVLGQLNKDDEAVRLLKEAIRIDPTEPQYLADLACLYMKRRQLKEGLDAAERGLALDPANLACRIRQVEALVRLKNAAAAREAINFALDQDPNHYWVIANHGWVLTLEKQWDAATERLQEALRQKPDFPQGRYGLLEVLKHQHPLKAATIRLLNWFVLLAFPFIYLVVVCVLIGLLMFKPAMSFANDSERMNAALLQLLTPVGNAFGVLFPALAWLACAAAFWLARDPVGQYLVHPVILRMFSRQFLPWYRVLPLAAFVAVATTSTFAPDWSLRLLFVGILLGVLQYRIDKFGAPHGTKVVEGIANAIAVVALAMSVAAAACDSLPASGPIALPVLQNGFKTALGLFAVGMLLTVSIRFKR